MPGEDHGVRRASELGVPSALPSTPLLSMSSNVHKSRCARMQALCHACLFHGPGA